MRTKSPLLPLLASATLLSGCVAAAVPIVAGGMIAGKATRRAPVEGRAATRQAAPPAVAGPRAGANAGASAAGAPRPTPAATEPSKLPASVDQMVPGQIYVGSLPADRSAIAAAASLPPPNVPATSTAVTQPPTGSDWRQLVRFVAEQMDAPAHGALLARGSSSAAPTWTPCANKPRAVLAPLSLVLVGEGGGRHIAEVDRQWIDAIPTMGAKLVLVGAEPLDTAAKAEFASAGLPVPIADYTFVTAATEGDLPAARAAVGARYCVVAVAGRRGADFPNALLPATTPATLAGQWNAGWFLFGANPN